MVGDGCLIQPGCTISNSVVGLRSKIYANTIIEDSLLMGSDYYERPEDCELAAHCLPMGIGANSCAPSVPRSFSSAICRLFVFLRARSVLGSPPSTGTNLFGIVQRAHASMLTSQFCLWEGGCGLEGVFGCGPSLLSMRGWA